MSECVRCKRERKIHCRGLCASCYQTTYVQKRRAGEDTSRKPRGFAPCPNCGAIPRHRYKMGICHRCYQWRKRHNGLWWPNEEAKPSVKQVKAAILARDLALAELEEADLVEKVIVLPTGSRLRVMIPRRQSQTADYQQPQH